MGRAGIGFLLRVGAIAAGVAALCVVPIGRADDTKPGAKAADTSDDALKAELLKFNRPSSKEQLRTKLFAFTKDKERAKKGVALAYKIQKAAKGEDKPFNLNGALSIGEVAILIKEYKAAEYFFEFATEAATKLESGEKLVQAYDGLIAIYWEQKRYQDVVDLCERFVELKGPEEVAGDKPFKLERLVQAKARQGNTDEALRITESLIQLDEGGWYFVQLKGWVQREAGKLDDSIETYLDVIDKLEAAKRIPREQKDRLKDRMRYVLSGLYVDNNEVDKAIKQLEILIKRDEENAGYRNDLGFILADHDQKLDEAEKLIREAIDMDKKKQEKLKEEGEIDQVKDNAAYLDSLGWVLFKKKKYKEALTYMKKAVLDEDEGNHLEIWDHLADVYQALGQKKEATDAWQKGLTMEDISKRDIERRKKVIAKLKAAGIEPKVKEPEKKDTPKRKID